MDNLGLLPNYKSPPVDEVVLGVRFNTPDKLRIPHIGLLWEKFRQDYPIIEHAAPIAMTPGEIPIDVATGLPQSRVWFIKKSQDQLVQFQTNRFFFNWRRREADYPRYQYMIESFEKIYDTVSKFFIDNDLGPLQSMEYELTYINHLRKGREWGDGADLKKIFSDFVWQGNQERFLPEPKNISWRANYSLGEGNGDLSIKLEHGRLITDKIPVFILSLTARSIVEPKDKENLRNWFDLAHEWIVRGFTDLTTSDVQKVWGREDNA